MLDHTAACVSRSVLSHCRRSVEKLRGVGRRGCARASCITRCRRRSSAAEGLKSMRALASSTATVPRSMASFTMRRLKGDGVFGPVASICGVVGVWDPPESPIENLLSVTTPFNSSRRGFEEYKKSTSRIV